MKFIRRIFKIVNDNFKIKLGICIGLIMILIIVITSGIIYSNKINNEKLSLKMFSTKKIEKNEQEKNVKDNNLEVKKGEKLESLKIKIKELDNNINIDESKGDLDKDLLYYERLYNELSKKKEEEKAEENSINTTIEESNIQFDNTYEQGQSPNLN